MKQIGCSILIIDDQGRILLLLRDNIPEIPYPGMWDVPGGHVEKGETPEQCIVREIKEEMGLDLQGFQRFSVIEFDDRTEYTFWQKANLDVDKIQLNEGQRLKWFTKDEVSNTELAYGFNRIVEDFFERNPFGNGL